MVVIGGHSGTIITDDGPHYASHNDVGLQEILENTFAGYDKSKMETVIAPQNNAPLHYSVQNNESSWQYAKRLAAQYSEWFYYDGKKLVFGKSDDGEAISLRYGHDLKEFSMSLNSLFWILQLYFPKPSMSTRFTRMAVYKQKKRERTKVIYNGRFPGTMLQRGFNYH